MSDVLLYLSVYFPSVHVPSEICHKIFKYLDIKIYVDDDTKIDILTRFFPLKILCTRFVKMKKLLMNCGFCTRDITGIIKCRNCKTELCNDCAISLEYCHQHYNCISCTECIVICTTCKTNNHIMVFKICDICFKSTCPSCSRNCIYCEAHVCHQCIVKKECKKCINDSLSVLKHMNEKFFNKRVCQKQ